MSPTKGSPWGTRPTKSAHSAGGISQNNLEETISSTTKGYWVVGVVVILKQDKDVAYSIKAQRSNKWPEAIEIKGNNEVVYSK